jgi:RNA polymerase sigma factor (sigma-70 family)
MASARSSASLAGQLGTLYHLGTAGTLTDGQLLEQFLARNDPAASEAAFTALVDRHGAMVLAVCQKVLGDPNDAHDAFQATFLILVNKAGSIRSRESVGGWLLGIARRVAARARVEGARRRRHLQQLGAERPNFKDGGDGPMPSNPEPDFAPLIAEVDRLPERFRAAVVLHYFEGLSTEATAQRLGCARGTVLSRLSRARSRIKKRLKQQGVSFAAFIPAGETLTRWIPLVPVPAGLAQTTVKAAGSLALAGAAIESVVPAAVASLSRGVARTLVFAKVRAAAALMVLAVAAVSIGLAATYATTDEPRRGVSGQAPTNPPQSAVAKSRTARTEVKAEGKDPGAQLVFRGQVLDPDGRPVAGAQMLLGLPLAGPGVLQAPRQLGTSGADGHFEVSIAREKIDRVGGEVLIGPVIAAIAPGFGPDWAAIAPKTAGAEITLRLRRDDVPIEGRVIGLEGQPVRDLTVTVGSIAQFPPKLLEKLRENAGKMNPELWGEMRDGIMLGKDGPIPSVRTRPDGRFRLAGVGRDRAVTLLIEGPSIEQSFAMVLTSADPAYRPLLLPAGGAGEQRLERPRFDLSVAPGRSIQGVVIDFDTRKPIAGAKIHSWVVGSTTTDAQGKFRIGGQPKGRENHLTVEVVGQPYIKVVKSVSDPSGVGPIPVEITLKRGRLVEGKVKNRANGSPVKAVVRYYPFRDNPHVQECTDGSFLNNNVSDEVDFPTDATGRFRAVALPGRGALIVWASEPGYVSGRKSAPDLKGKVLNYNGGFQSPMHQYQVAHVPIDVPADGNLTVPDVALAPARPQHLLMIGPDGQPVAGTKVVCHQRQPFADESLPSSECTFIHQDPGAPETLVVLQADRSLGATLELKGDEPDPLRVVLVPTGRISGRLVDTEGRPRPNVGLSLSRHLKTRGGSISADRFDPVSTGPDGRFQFRNLVPGVRYTVTALKKNEPNFSFRDEGYLHKNQWTIKSGETLDWGDVQVQTYRR